MTRVGSQRHRKKSIYNQYKIVKM